LFFINKVSGIDSHHLALSPGENNRREKLTLITSTQLKKVPAGTTKREWSVRSTYKSDNGHPGEPIMYARKEKQNKKHGRNNNHKLPCQLITESGPVSLNINSY
jgi:hypothetical protein